MPICPGSRLETYVSRDGQLRIRTTIHPRGQIHPDNILNRIEEEERTMNAIDMDRALDLVDAYARINASLLATKQPKMLKACNRCEGRGTLYASWRPARECPECQGYGSVWTNQGEPHEHRTE